VTIDRLSSLSAQIAALRAELSRSGRDKRLKGDADHIDEAIVDAPHNERAPDALRKQLAELVQGVSLEDANDLNHARRRVVKAVLLWELGQELREHSEWQPMIEKIVDTLAADDNFHNVFNRLIAELQA
jgi:hypothetical protein